MEFIGFGHMDESVTIEKSETPKVKVGDLFYAIWGYDQTNYDFIVVKEISKTGKTVKCQNARARENLEKSTEQTHALQPINEGFGDVFRMRVETGYQGQVNLRGTYADCQGKAGFRLGTFYPVDPSKCYHETDSMFGH